MTERRRREGPVAEVGLALRADRRRRGQSQRAYAAERGISRDLLARAEVDGSGLQLGMALELLEGTGFTLAIVREDAALEPITWEATDLVATTRSGSRFPPHRKVRESSHGPMWWHYHEVYGAREYRPQPGWTAEGFPIPKETRYGKAPRPLRPDEPPRWPY